MDAKEITVVLTSESPIKLEACETFFKGINKMMKIVPFGCDKLELPAQPINDSTIHCAQARAFYAMEKCGVAWDYMVSIESGVFVSKGVDVCFVFMVKNKESSAVSYSGGIRIDQAYVSALQEYKERKHSDKIFGYDVTIGEIIQGVHAEVDPKNWMKFLKGVDRKVQITDALRKGWAEISMRDVVKNAYSVPDVFTILRDPIVVRKMMDIMASPYEVGAEAGKSGEKDKEKEKEKETDKDKNRGHDHKIDFIVAEDVHSHVFGTMLAYRLQKGFILARKQDGLIEIQTDVPDGTRILLIDSSIVSTDEFVEVVVESPLVIRCKVDDYYVLRKVVVIKNIMQKVKLPEHVHSLNIGDI